MEIPRHKVFISYHHANDQDYKDALINWNEANNKNIFIDVSVDTGSISDNLSDQRIRQIIRDDYLQDSTVTILLVGVETQKRKHIDWELYSSMYDGQINKKSGILVINLPSTNCTLPYAPHGDIEKELYPSISWTSITNRTDYEVMYPYMPARIINNLLKTEAKVSVTDWVSITKSPERLKYLIDIVCNARSYCDYDHGRSMRKNNA